MRNSNDAVTLSTLSEMKQAGEPIACLTAYDASFARLMDKASVDVILIGDSLGMVMQGHDSTNFVSVSDIVYHCRCVKRAIKRAYLVADMPFMSINSQDQALYNACRIMQEGGAKMVKVEADEKALGIIRVLRDCSVPVCAHIGLLPQQEYQKGDMSVRGKTRATAAALLAHAEQCVEHGADIILMECIAADLARQITQKLSVPVIGIGCGPDCDGQILVMHDVIGASKQCPGFAANFLSEASSLEEAFSDYISAVRAKRFPLGG